MGSLVTFSISKSIFDDKNDSRKTSAVEDVEEKNLLLVRMQNGTTTLENSLEVSQNVKHRVTTQLIHFISRHKPKRNENIRPCKNLHTNGHDSIRHPKVQTIHMSAMQGKRGLLTQRSAVWTERGMR